MKIVVMRSLFIATALLSYAQDQIPQIILDTATRFSCTSEPENIYHARQRMIKAQQEYEDRKEEIKKYYKSGRYEKDVQCVVRNAKKYIDSLCPMPCKPVVVFDIDDTCFSSFRYHEKRGFLYDQASYDEWLSNFNVKAIKEILDLFNYIKEKGITIFFITGRREKHRKTTQTHLERAGFHGAHYIFFTPSTGIKPKASLYKPESREKIEKQGYTIVATIGDQESDLVGGHAMRGFKLPNPMYIIQ